MIFLCPLLSVCSIRFDEEFKYNNQKMAPTGEAVERNTSGDDSSGFLTARAGSRCDEEPEFVPSPSL